MGEYRAKSVKCAKLALPATNPTFKATFDDVAAQGRALAEPEESLERERQARSR